jgi:hypothetical protein
MSGKHLHEPAPRLRYESFIRNHPVARPGKYLVSPVFLVGAESLRGEPCLKPVDLPGRARGRRSIERPGASHDHSLCTWLSGGSINPDCARCCDRYCDLPQSASPKISAARSRRSSVTPCACLRAAAGRWKSIPKRITEHSPIKARWCGGMSSDLRSHHGLRVLVACGLAAKGGGEVAAGSSREPANEIAPRPGDGRL